MVKFSKELEAQLIPEWKDAFVNYWQLKKQVKKIKVSRVPKQASDADYGVSIFDPIRFVAKKISDKLFNFDNKLTEIIQVLSYNTHVIYVVEGLLMVVVRIWFCSSVRFPADFWRP